MADDEGYEEPVAGDASLVNGVVMTVAGLAEDHTAIWQSRMYVLNQQAKDDRIWQNDFSAEDRKKMTVPIANLSAARSALEGLLQEAIELCQRHEVEFWNNTFTNALATLAAPAPEPKYYLDSLAAMPDNLEARQLITAAYDSFVFGGMGSWNDLYFDDDQLLYEDLTNRMFAAVKDALVAATNTSR